MVDDLERHALIIKKTWLVYRKWLNTHEDLKPIMYGSAKSTMDSD